MSHTLTLTVIDREEQQRTVSWEQGQSLMEALRDNDLPLLASCGGTASCATCHVFLEPAVVDGLGERSDDEQELLDESEYYDRCRSRLSCQVAHTTGLDGILVTLAPEED